MVRAAGVAGVAPGQVFALARAVVCGWWEREQFWAREPVWGSRLERVVAATRRLGPVGWGGEQWRLLARDVVVFPEIVTVAQVLLDPRLRQLAAGGGAADGLVRGGVGGERVAAALGERLDRVWLAEVDGGVPSGPLASWVQAVVRERRRPAGLRLGGAVWVVVGAQRAPAGGRGAGAARAGRSFACGCG